MANTYIGYLVVSTVFAGLVYASVDYAYNGPKMSQIKPPERSQVSTSPFGVTNSWAYRK